MHIFHKWGKWKLKDGYYTSYFGGTYPGIVQKRECQIENCNKVQVTRV